MGRSIEYHKEWPRLQAKTRLGKTKYWIIRISKDEERASIHTEYWQDEGEHQSSCKEVTRKNLGRSNETTALDQAISEAQASYQKQLDKGYSKTGKSTLKYELPMLAQDYKKRKHKIRWPCFVSAKIDGFRCLFSSAKGFWSRGGKPFFKQDPTDSIDLNHLWFDTKDLIIDGELILPPPYTFQQTCEAIKKQRPETSLLQFHVFDLIDLSDLALSFELRYDLLRGLEDSAPSGVKLVPAISVENEDKAMELHESFMLAGHEGTIFRNIDGPYQIGHRSTDLQKYKEFQDNEFEIVQVVDGNGKEKGAAVFICKTKDGQEFKTRPRGSYEERQAQYKNRKNLLGKQLTVRYQALSDSGIPRFPVGLSIRESWDN